MCFQRTWFFILKSPYGVCVVNAGHSLSGSHVYLGSGSQFSLEILMEGLLQGPPGKQMTYMQHDLVQAGRSISDLGWVLTAWRSSPLAETQEALGTLQKMGCCIYGVQGVTSQKLKTQLSCRQKCASCEPLTARPWNYRISNTKSSHRGCCRDLWYLIDSLRRHFIFQPNLRSDF